MNNLVVLNNMKAVQETVEQLVVNTEVFASQRKCAVAMVDIANKYNAMVLEGKVNYTVEVAANGMDSENQWVRLVTEGLFDGAEWALENILETFNINTKGLCKISLDLASDMIFSSKF